jgi:nitroimidazol reductase NimA-like FMN-containing flavoprotein (pyridoxamine 5'-phosphate oxidase superfamily)
MESFAIGPLNKVRRPDRASYDKAAVHAVLDEGLVAHVGFSDHDRPVVVPMVYGRDGDLFYLHGAKAARFAKAMGAGVPVCVTVTLTDGIVVGRSAFHCSMNYRAVVLHGQARLVSDPAEAERALAAVTDHLLPGRWAESRPMIDKELRATAVLRVEIEAASLKARSGPPIDEPEDYALPIWAGVIPLRIAASAPETDAGLLEGVDIPASVRARARL